MEYDITGGAFPLLICRLQKGESMKDDSGAMTFMTSEVKMETSTGGGFLKGIGRALSGDSMFINKFTAQADNQEVGFASCTPGKIIPIRLDGSRNVIGQKSSFLAAE